MKLWPFMFYYPLTKGILYLQRYSWKLQAHVLVVGPYAFMVVWRVPSDTESP